MQIQRNKKELHMPLVIALKNMAMQMTSQRFQCWNCTLPKLTIASGWAWRVLIVLLHEKKRTLSPLRLGKARVFRVQRLVRRSVIVIFKRMALLIAWLRRRKSAVMSHFGIFEWTTWEAILPLERRPVVTGGRYFRKYLTAW